MQATGRVHDRDVAAASARRLDGVERDRRRICAAWRPDEVGIGTLRPDLELFLGRSTERVGRADEHRTAVLGELPGELPDRRRLSGSVHAHDENDARVAAEGECGWLAEERFDLLDERLLEVSGDAARLQPAHELRSRRNTDVAADERLLEPLPGLVVRGVERRRRELGSQCAATLRQRLAHASEEACALGLVLRGDLVAEELGPGATHAVAASACWCCGSRRETTCDTPSGPIVTP